MSNIEKKNPVNAKKFTYQILLSKGKGKLTRLAEQMIVDLAYNAIRKKTYYLQEDKEDALQTSLFNMLNNWMSFNPEKTDNAFAYFTEIHNVITKDTERNYKHTDLSVNSIHSLGISSK